MRSGLRLVFDAGQLGDEVERALCGCGSCSGRKRCKRWPIIGCFGTVMRIVFMIAMELESVVSKRKGILTLRFIAGNMLIEHLDSLCIELCWNCSFLQYPRLWS